MVVGVPGISVIEEGTEGERFGVMAYIGGLMKLGCIHPGRCILAFHDRQ
jgi:hypothetical protein